MKKVEKAGHKCGQILDNLLSTCTYTQASTHEGPAAPTVSKATA